MKSRMTTAYAAFFMLTATMPSALGGSMRAELTPEEHAVYAQQMHGADWRSLSLQQRCARMAQMRTQWQSMSPEGRNQLKHQLDARLQTMPVAQKQAIDRRIAAHQARRAQNGGRRGQGRCAGMKARSAP